MYLRGSTPGSEKAMIHRAVTANAAQEGEQEHHPFKKNPEMGSGFCSCYLDVVLHNSPSHGSAFGCSLEYEQEKLWASTSP